MMTDLTELNMEALQQTFALYFYKLHDRFPTANEQIDERSMLIRRIRMMQHNLRKL